MPTNSFDIVSQINLQEVNNAVHQASKEIRTRYDLKSTNSSIELDQAEPRTISPGARSSRSWNKNSFAGKFLSKAWFTRSRSRPPGRRSFKRSVCNKEFRLRRRAKSSS